MDNRPSSDRQQKTVSETRTQSDVCQNTNPSLTKPKEYQKENGFQISKQSGQAAKTVAAPLCDTFETGSNVSTAESSKHKLITDGGSVRSGDEAGEISVWGRAILDTTVDILSLQE